MESEIDTFSGEHWRVIDYRQRVTRKEAQNILLQHPTIIFKGRIYDVKIKHIGAGIYEVFKDTRRPK